MIIKYFEFTAFKAEEQHKNCRTFLTRMNFRQKKVKMYDFALNGIFFYFIFHQRTVYLHENKQ